MKDRSLGEEKSLPPTGHESEQSTSIAQASTAKDNGAALLLCRFVAVCLLVVVTIIARFLEIKNLHRQYTAFPAASLFA